MAVNLLICQYALTESDDVISAIRIVDAFTYAPLQGANRENQRLRFSVVAQFKANPGGSDVRKHLAEIRFLKPDGDADLIVRSDVDFTPKEPDVPAGHTVIVNVTTAITAPGLYYVCAFFDGEEVSRIPVTLREENPA